MCVVADVLLVHEKIMAGKHGIPFEKYVWD